MHHVVHNKSPTLYSLRSIHSTQHTAPFTARHPTHSLLSTFNSLPAAHRPVHSKASTLYSLRSIHSNAAHRPVHSKAPTLYSLRSIHSTQHTAPFTARHPPFTLYVPFTPRNTRPRSQQGTHSLLSTLHSLRATHDPVHSKAPTLYSLRAIHSTQHTTPFTKTCLPLI